MGRWRKDKKKHQYGADIQATQEMANLRMNEDELSGK